MDNQGIKETAESVLRELPGVVGAFVQPDAFGGPREIHLLIQHGPRPRDFAQQVRAILESRLRIPIDQRIISIAQLAEERTDGIVGDLEAETPAPQRAATADAGRIRLIDVESRVAGARVTTRVSIEHEDSEVMGEATEFETGDGRARAAALATVRAVNQITADQARLGLDFAATVEAVGQPYVLISVTVASPLLGRRSLELAGAQQIDEDAETSAALATLKAVNRVLGFLLGRAERKPRFPPHLR